MPICQQEYTYIYDGSFEGLLTIVYQVSRLKSMPENIISGNAESPLLFHDYISIATDNYKANQVIKAIQKRLPASAYKNILIAFFSGAEKRELKICRYLLQGWKYGLRLDHFLTHTKVKPLLELVTKIHNEYHRMAGLVRFKHTQTGIYFAQVATDYNQLPLLSHHFAKRMPGQQWIIHDTKRALASIFQEKKWEMVTFKITDYISYKETELFYQDLWNTYFTNITIKERENRQLQKKFIPERYWHYLVEALT